jgi:hypothetical protein
VDKFEYPDERDTIFIPAEAGQVMKRASENEGAGLDGQGAFRKGVGKLLHMMRWSRPDTFNAVRELSRNMTHVATTHMKALYRVTKYCATTKDRGLVLKPDRAWNGLPSHEFVIAEKADSTYYVSCPDTMRSVSGQTTLLEGGPVVMRSKMQKVVALSSTEAELMSGTECAQDMLYSMRVVESLGLKVKNPMILEIDNKGAVDIANNWSVGGRTRHIDTRFYFLRELKEANLIKTLWKSGTEMSSDILTKNLARPLFEKHLRVYCGEEQYTSREQFLCPPPKLCA